MAKRTRRATPGTGSVFYDHKRKRWVGKVVLDGKQRAVYAADRIDARDKLNRVIAGTPAPSSSTPTASASSGTTVAELLDVWLARDVAGRGLAPSTAARHAWAAAHWTEHVGRVHLAALTVKNVEDSLDRMFAAGELSRESLIKILGSLTQALRFAERRGEVGRNVAAHAIVPATARRGVRRRSLSPDDARRLLDVLRDEPLGLLFALSLRLGLRPGEAAALSWRDVELDRGVITVNRGVRLDGRGRATISDDLKVDSARRSLELPADLAAWLRDQRAAATVVALDGSSLLFPAASGGPMSPGVGRKLLAEICERAGVPVVLPNELRHSCASLLIDQGAPIERVADLLGHNSTRMVDMTYRHRVRPTIDTAVASDWTIANGTTSR